MNEKMREKVDEDRLDEATYKEVVEELRRLKEKEAGALLYEVVVGHRATWKCYTRVPQRTTGPAGVARKWQTSMGQMAQPFGRPSLSSCGMRH